MGSGQEELKKIGAWSEQLSSQGRKYYYNSETEVSQWDKPQEWRDHELRVEQERRAELQRVQELQAQQQRMQVQPPPPPPVLFPPPFFPPNIPPPPGFPGFPLSTPPPQYPHSGGPAQGPGGPFSSGMPCQFPPPMPPAVPPPRPLNSCPPSLPNSFATQFRGGPRPFRAIPGGPGTPAQLPQHSPFSQHRSGMQPNVMPSPGPSMHGRQSVPGPSPQFEKLKMPERSESVSTEKLHPYAIPQPLMQSPTTWPITPQHNSNQPFVTPHPYRREEPQPMISKVIKEESPSTSTDKPFPQPLMSKTLKRERSPEQVDPASVKKSKEEKSPSPSADLSNGAETAEADKPWMRFYDKSLANQKRKELGLDDDDGELSDLVLKCITLESRLIQSLIKVKEAEAKSLRNASEISTCEAQIALFKEQQKQIEQNKSQNGARQAMIDLQRRSLSTS